MINPEFETFENQTIERPFALNMSKVYLQACSELLNPPPSLLLADWLKFNKVTGGFRMREFSIVCGATGAGKTTFLSNLSAQFLKSGIKHFVMSVETGHTDFMKRIMSVFSGLDVNTGDPVMPDVLARINSNYEKYLHSDLIEFSLYDNRVNADQLIADLDYMARVKGCKVAMIDNLNFFMEVSTAANSVIEMDKVVHKLIMFCKRTDMHVVMVMHPKKTEHGRVESEFDIKGSSTAVQEAHNVFLFNRPDANNLNRQPFDREIRIAKMRRRGAYVGKTIVFRSVNTRYDELEVV